MYVCMYVYILIHDAYICTYIKYKFYLIIGIGNIISNDIATVRVTNLRCEVTYYITAGGRDGGTGELIGPRSSLGTITAGPCPVMMTTTMITTSIAGKI